MFETVTFFPNKKDVDLRKSPWNEIYRKVTLKMLYDQTGFRWAYNFYAYIQSAEALLHLDEKFKKEYYNNRWERFVAFDKVICSYIPIAYFCKPTHMGTWGWELDNNSFIEMPDPDASIKDFEALVVMNVL